MLKAAAKAASLAIVGVLALTGCTVTNPRVAAYVAGTPITQAEVDAVSGALADASPDTSDSAGGFVQTVLVIMVQNRIAAKAAADARITVTDAQRQSVFAQNELYGVLAENPVSADFMNDFANTSVVVSDEAGVTAFREAAAQTNVRLNPRFGEWDAESVSLVQGSSGSLSELAPIQQG